MTWRKTKKKHRQWVTDLHLVAMERRVIISCVIRKTEYVQRSINHIQKTFENLSRIIAVSVPFSVTSYWLCPLVYSWWRHMTWNYVTSPHYQYLETAILDFLHFNPSPPDCLMEFCKVTLTFVCGRNPMMWPFKWKLSACTFTWCHLFLTILENEIWSKLSFGHIWQWKS